MQLGSHIGSVSIQHAEWRKHANHSLPKAGNAAFIQTTTNLPSSSPAELASCCFPREPFRVNTHPTQCVCVRVCQGQLGHLMNAADDVASW